MNTVYGGHNRLGQGRPAWTTEILEQLLSLVPGLDLIRILAAREVFRERLVGLMLAHNV